MFFGSLKKVDIYFGLVGLVIIVLLAVSQKKTHEAFVASSANASEGIRRGEIPPGDEDLYVLKSSIVPPICPKCPDVAASGGGKCPPCPPCGRCPESQFECKKVPNYNAGPNVGGGFGGIIGAGDGGAPMPTLTSFSTFGL